MLPQGTTASERGAYLSLINLCDGTNASENMQEEAACERERRWTFSKRRRLTE